MPIREIITCLLIILIPYTCAYADSTIEIRRQRGLILLENFQHSAGLAYQYSGHTGDTSDSDYRTNKFEETYRFLFAGAIMDRHLLNFSLSGDIWYQQIESSSNSQGTTNSSGSKYQYSLGASAFDRSWHPVNIQSSRTLNTVANAYTPTYESDSTNNGIQVYLQKGPVPTKIGYTRYTMDLSGAGYDSSSTTDAFYMSGTHNYRDFSATSLSGAWSKSNSHSQGVDQNSGNYSIGFGNNLTWGPDMKYSLGSQLNWQETETADVPQQNITLNEILLAQLGEALSADMTYRYLHNKTTTLNGIEQVYSSNALGASITHHLYQSLDTRLRAQVSRSDLLGGTEDTYSGSGSLTYKKKLPSFSLLTVVLYGEHAVTDRQSDVSSITIRDERHSVLQPNEIINLDVPGPIEAGSVTVKGFLLPPANPQDPPTFEYTEGVNYNVDYNLGKILWIGPPPPVSTILVTYVALIDSALKYSTDTMSASGNLSFLSGKYSILASIYNQNQNLIDGPPQNSLRETTIKRLRFLGRTPETIYGLEYEDYSSGPSQYQFLEGWYLYTHTAPLWAMTLQARDRYTNYDSVGTSNGYGQNTFSASVNGSRSLDYGLLLSLGASLVDTRRDNSDANDSVYAKASLRARFNRLDITLMGQTSWRFYGNVSTRDDYIRCNIVRYF